MDDTSPGRVMLVSAHRTLRHALRHALVGLGVDVVADVAPGPEAVVAAVCHHPHVVLVDVASDPPAGLDTCRQFRRAAINTDLVVLAPRLGTVGHQARAESVSGLVDTEVSLPDLAEFLGRACAARPGRARAGTTRTGGVPEPLLTPREHEVLSLAATGLSDGQISRALYISYKTVRNHLHHVYTKLGARSRTEAVTVGLRHGLITL